MRYGNAFPFARTSTWPYTGTDMGTTPIKDVGKRPLWQVSPRVADWLTRKSEEVKVIVTNTRDPDVTLSHALTQGLQKHSFLLMLVHQLLTILFISTFLTTRRSGISIFCNSPFLAFFVVVFCFVAVFSVLTATALPKVMT